MRKAAIFLTLFSCSSFAQSLLEVHFEKQKKEHHYSIKRDQKKKNSYIFSFVDEKRKVKSKYITSKQVEQIKNEANRLLWANQFRKPASIANCKKYLTLAVENEKTIVCQQNNIVTGKSFGFLNSLNNLARD